MVRNIADAAKARRFVLGLTAAQVSDRTAVGKPLSRAVISDLETGRKRTLDISELLTLATALELSPLSLIFPDVLDEVEILPGVSMSGIDALGWFSGIGDAVLGERLYPFSTADNGMRVAMQLVTVEGTLRVQRHNLLQMERGPELLSMSDRMKAYAEDKANHARAQIELLEAEREDLVNKYRRIMEPDY